MSVSRAVVVAVVLSGCHVILPLEGRSPSSDGVSHVDRGGDAVHLDTTPDQGRDGTSPIVLPKGSPPLSSAMKTCAGCTTGDDCDGLPDARDPEPAICNELVYEETFSTDAVKSKRWLTRNGDWSWTTGWLQQKGIDNPEQSYDYYWAWATDATPPTRSYLVEVRLHLGAVAALTDWDAAIVARMSATLDQNKMPNEYLSCAMRMDSKDICWGCVPQRHITNPDLKVEMRSATTPNEGGTNVDGSWPLENQPNQYDPSPNQTYILQLWVQGGAQPQVNCRLCSDAGVPLRLAFRQMWDEFQGDEQYLPKLVGTVGLRTWDRAASYDYVRVFRLHQQGNL